MNINFQFWQVVDSTSSGKQKYVISLPRQRIEAVKKHCRSDPKKLLRLRTVKTLAPPLPTISTLENFWSCPLDPGGTPTKRSPSIMLRHLWRATTRTLPFLGDDACTCTFSWASEILFQITLLRKASRVEVRKRARFHERGLGDFSLNGGDLLGGSNGAEDSAEGESWPNCRLRKR